MNKIKNLFAAGIAAIFLGSAGPVSANLIIDVLSGKDGSGFSYLHKANTRNNQQAKRVRRFAS